MEETKKDVTEKVVTEQVGASEATAAAKPAEERPTERPRQSRQGGGRQGGQPGQRPGGRQQGRRRQHGRRRPVKDYTERVVHINRVAKTTKGGRRLRFTAVVVVGYGKGKYGFGNAKAQEVPDAIKKAIEVARKNTFTVELVKGDTIAHEIVGRFGASRVFLKPAPEGTGVIAGGPVRAVLELAGVRNVYSKVYGSRTPLNVIKATDNGLRNLKRADEVARLRA